MWGWLTENKEWVFSGIGVAVLGSLWWVFKKLGSRQEHSPSTNTVTQSPSINVSPTIHLSHSQPPEPPKQPRPDIPRSQPNLICLGAQTIRVHFSNNQGRQFFYETADQDAFYAVIACLRNEPSRDARRAEQVRVNMIYRDNDGNEIGTGIPRASWLGDNADMMDFHVGDRHCMLLVVREPEGTLSNLEKERRRATDGWLGDTIKSNVYHLHEGLKTIELRVLSGNDLLMEPVRFSFSVIDGRPTATRI